jgi:hypothetical protein
MIEKIDLNANANVFSQAGRRRTSNSAIDDITRMTLVGDQIQRVAVVR